MNCLKCPILEECHVSKLTVTTIYLDEFTIPEKVMALNAEECLLLVAIAKANELPGR